MCIGHTLGEEILFGAPGLRRTESVVAMDHSCVLQVNVKTFGYMRMQKHVVAGGGTLFKDYATLLYILESHYI